MRRPGLIISTQLPHSAGVCKYRGMKSLLLLLAFTASVLAGDNELTDAEKSGGW